MGFHVGIYIYIYGHRPPQALHFVGPKGDKHIYVYIYQSHGRHGIGGKHMVNLCRVRDLCFEASSL